MKKILAIVILLFLIMMAGCTKKPTDTEPEQVQPVVTEKEAPIENSSQNNENSSNTYDENNLSYKEIFFDGFDTDGELDKTKWNYETGGNGFGNNEKQYYTDATHKNAFVSDGNLIIEARKETYKSQEYTSAKITSKRLLDIQYGLIEIRAKLPQGKGTWPALWMLPTSYNYGDWPNSGEIDIMEHVGFDMGVIHGTIHTKAFNHKLNTQKAGIVNLENVDETYHIYTLEWLPDKLKFGVDGNVYYVYDPKEFVDKLTTKEWPFDMKFYLIMNIAIGGDWGGQQGIDDAIFPQKMIIDYVKVSQADEINQWAENQK